MGGGLIWVGLVMGMMMGSGVIIVRFGVFLSMD